MAPQKLTVTIGSSLTRSTWSNWPLSKLSSGRPSMLILLFHGFPDISDGWLPIMDILDQEFPNTLILAPTMKGYETSSSGLPDSAYHLDEIAKEFLLWTELSKGSPIHVVGHDWGACAAYRALKLYPNAFSSVTTMAIPHSMLSPLTLLKVPWQLWLSSYMIVMNLPFIYRPRFSQKNPIPYMQGLIEYWSPGYDMPIEHLNAIADTIHIPGVMDSTTAYYRNLYKLAGVDWTINWDKRLKVIGGRKDGCVSVRLFHIDRAAQPDNVTILDTVGHFMQREDPALVAKEVISHVKNNGQ